MLRSAAVGVSVVRHEIEKATRGDGDDHDGASGDPGDSANP